MTYIFKLYDISLKLSEMITIDEFELGNDTNALSYAFKLSEENNTTIIYNNSKKETLKVKKHTKTS